MSNDSPDNTHSNASQPGGMHSGNRDYSPLARRFLWADDAGSVDRLVFWLMCLCALLVVIDVFYHRHTYVPGEGLWGFYALVGFVAFACIVLGAKQLRRLILRNENYYSPYSVDAENYPEQGLEKRNHHDEASP